MILALAGFVAALPLVVAAFMFGLYRGERGRREAAERLITSGSPTGSLASRIADQPDAEILAMGAGKAAANRRFSDDTIRGGMKQVQEEAERLGRPLTDEQARQQVEAMLYGSSGSEGDLAELGL